MKRKKVQSKSFSILAIIVKIYFYFCLCAIIYGLILVPILTSILKHHGSRCEAIITSDESSLVHRWTSNNYLYEFNIGDKTYTGNSLIRVGNSDKIGDKIEILYFDFLPSFNRPIYFYEEE